MSRGMRFVIPGDGKVAEPMGNSCYGKQRRTKTRNEEAEEKETLISSPIRSRLGRNG